MLSDIFSVYTMVEAVWLVLPVYAANGLVPLARGKRPVDFGRKFIDGKPLLGPGKTVEGFVAACLIGALIAFVEQLAFPYLPWGLSDRTLTIVAMTPFLGFVLGLSAISGDSVGSFIKRRLDLERGRPAPLLDQLDFLVAAFLAASLLVTVKLEWFILMAILTPIFHWLASVTAFRLKLKKEPW
jgi:CDP-2,3-bis-(O-geranylgeranyl)-sn-glycerol synthase